MERQSDGIQWAVYPTKKIDRPLLKGLDLVTSGDLDYRRG